MFGLGTTELLVIGGIVLLLFGGSKLPKLGRSMGAAITNFKKGLSDPNSADDDKKKVDEDKKES